MPGCTSNFRFLPFEHEDQMRIMFEAIIVTNETSYVAMVALEWMASGNLHNKTMHNSSLPVMTGIQWVELTLQNPVDCYDMFRMRRSVFLRLHDTLV